MANNSNYNNVHAFNRKRTLAQRFYIDYKVTHANNKEFIASGLRNKLAISY
jgi:hypothetical protein